MATLPRTASHGPADGAVSRLRKMIMALAGSVVLANSALAQAPGLLWSTNIGATLFAVDEQTNLYANRGGDVIVLNGSGVPQQTNTICPLPGMARRDGAGNYYFAGLLDGTQDFGGITLVGGRFDQFNRGAYEPGYPSGYVAKYGANGQLQGAALGGGSPGLYSKDTISDLLPDPVGGCYMSSSVQGPGGYSSLFHFDGVKMNWQTPTPVTPPSPWTGIATFARLGGASVSNCFYLGFFPGLYWPGNVDLAGNIQAFSSWLTPADVATNGSPVIDDSGQVLMIGTNYAQQVLRKCSVSGSPLWEVSLSGEAQWTLARDSQAGLYAGGGSGTLFKYYLGDGTFIWSTNLGKVCVNLIVDGTGNRFVAFADGSLPAYSRTRRHWRLPTRSVRNRKLSSSVIRWSCRLRPPALHPFSIPGV